MLVTLIFDLQQLVHQCKLFLMLGLHNQTGDSMKEWKSPTLLPQIK